MTIAVATRRPGLETRSVEARRAGQAQTETEAEDGGGRRSLRRRVTRFLLVVGAGLAALILVVGGCVGYELYRIDHAVHHVGISSSLLARGKNDLLAIVKGPHHDEEAYVFHTGRALQRAQHSEHVGAAGRRRPDGAAFGPQRARRHRPSSPASTGWASRQPLRRGGPAHGEPLVEPRAPGDGKAVGDFAHLDPTATGSLLAQVASHMYLGPGTPVSAGALADARAHGQSSLCTDGPHQRGPRGARDRPSPRCSAASCNRGLPRPQSVRPACG